MKLKVDVKEVHTRKLRTINSGSSGGCRERDGQTRGFRGQIMQLLSSRGPVVELRGNSRHFHATLGLTTFLHRPPSIFKFRGRLCGFLTNYVSDSPA